MLSAGCGGRRGAFRIVVVGTLTGVFGIRGELKCRASSVGADAFEAGRSYRVGEGAQAHTLRCRSVRRHHEKLLVAFDEIETPEDAKAFVGCAVSIEAQDVVLGAGEYLDRDLIGMRLLDEAGVDLGRVVSGVVHYPAQDCLVVEPGKKLVPLVKAFIRRVDLDRRAIVTSLPDGLFD